MIGKALSILERRPELVILLLVLVIIAMLVFPLPTVLVDFLIATNMVIALLVFMGSFYIERILGFSSFPAVLLITTLFRLALSISTSRLVLLEADAGKIIATFGQFVIGDSLVVGFVIFFIVTIVQFIVITKGSERVAEVAARFSLDGMPGKQMSIDADLKAGTIDANQARERRSVLEKESQLYGAFDGAMKFIKGDAIVGIIIIFVNFIGGMSVGVMQHGMDVSSALSTYTILTIGDGLVAQIPSLLISISAGFIVTRVSGEGKNLGENMMRQLFSSPFILIVTGCLALALGLLPGFPLVVFALLAIALFAAYYRKTRHPAASSGAEAGASGSGKSGGAASGQAQADGSGQELERIMTATLPIMLLLSSTQKATCQPTKLAYDLRLRFFTDFGVKLPEIKIDFSDTLDAEQVLVLVNEVRAGQLTICFDSVKVVNASPEIEALGLAMLTVPDASGNPTYWCDAEHAEALTSIGVELRSPQDELYASLAVLLTHMVSEFFGVQETKNLLDQMEQNYPDLLKEVYRHASVQRIAEVFQRLLQERISIRNLKLILESLALWAGREKDVIALVECVRGSLARYISHKFAHKDELRVLLLSAQLEEQVRQGIRQTASGTFLNLEPEASEHIIDTLAISLDQARVAAKDVVLLTSVDIRRFVKRLLEPRFDALAVLSYGEIADSISVNVISTGGEN